MKEYQIHHPDLIQTAPPTIHHSTFGIVSHSRSQRALLHQRKYPISILSQNLWHFSVSLIRVMFS